MKNKNNINKYGFTLIELLLVIVIIGILAGVVLAIVKPTLQQGKATESVLKSNVNKMCLALFGCASTTTNEVLCDDIASIGITTPTQPKSAAYSVTLTNHIVTVDGAIKTKDSTTSCRYSCSYDFSSSTPKSITASTTSVCFNL